MDQCIFFLVDMGKKGKKGGKKGSGKKKKGGKKKGSEPQMTWKEALLAYQ